MASAGQRPPLQGSVVRTILAASPLVQPGVTAGSAGGHLGRAAIPAGQLTPVDAAVIPGANRLRPEPNEAQHLAASQGPLSGARVPAREHYW
jgi:hypothetical protein